MQFLSFYELYFKQSLTNSQLQTLKILVWLLTIQKTVKLERFAASFPLLIKSESHRKHIQGFLISCIFKSTYISVVRSLCERTTPRLF